MFRSFLPYTRDRYVGLSRLQAEPKIVLMLRYLRQRREPMDQNEKS